MKKINEINNNDAQKNVIAFKTKKKLKKKN